MPESLKVHILNWGWPTGAVTWGGSRECLAPGHQFCAAAGFVRYLEHPGAPVRSAGVSFEFDTGYLWVLHVVGVPALCVQK